MKRLLAFFLLVVFASSQVFSWGPTGHRVIGTVAQNHISENTKRNIQSLLGNNTLASVANWADQIKNQRDETYDWHFVDIPKSASGFDETRDCFRNEGKHKNDNTDHQNCVVDRIEMFAKVLGDANASRNDRIEALKFIVHFVGDVHQPFHAIGDFTGANGIHVTAFGSKTCEGNKKCNLHYEWDSGMIEHTGMNQADYVSHLEQLVQDDHLNASGDPEKWADESHKDAVAAWLNEGDEVDDSYYNKEIKVLDNRLALAGLRLAALLDDTFKGKSPKDFKKN